MLKKTITYTDFNGDEVSEDFYFHLSKAELVELEVSREGGLQEALKRIIETEDGKEIIAEFKNIILSSCGQRSEDGKRFVKNQAVRDEFESTEAYSALFMELVTDADKAAEFVRGVIPQDLAEEAAKIAAQVPVVAETPASEEKEVVKKEDLMTMSKEDFARTQQRITDGEVELVE